MNCVYKDKTSTTIFEIEHELMDYMTNNKCIHQTNNYYHYQKDVVSNCEKLRVKFEKLINSGVEISNILVDRFLEYIQTNIYKQYIQDHHNIRYYNYK